MVLIEVFCSPMARAVPHLDRLTRRPSPLPRSGCAADGRPRTRLEDTPSGVAVHGFAVDVDGVG